MAYNKVVYNGNTLIDLTEDTATAEDVAVGKTFHLASGVQATGTGSTGAVQTVDGFSPDANGAVTTERVLTQAEYDALTTAEKENGMTYYISDGDGGSTPVTASEVTYINTASGLSSITVQGAIDELTTVQAGTLTQIPSSMTLSNSSVERCGKNGILSLEIRQAAGFTADSWTQVYNSSIKPTSAKHMMITNVTGTITVNFTAAGLIQVYPHNVANAQSIRAVIPFFAAD